MAEKRMFAKTIIDSDAFLDMSMGARLLYYDLSMRADDDGFINAPKKVMRITGSSQEDLQELIDNKFIILFEEKGIVVIKHWYINNYIRKDMYKETNYKDEKSMLTQDENKAYSLVENVQNDVTSRTCNDFVTNPLRTRDEPVTTSSRTCNEPVTNPSTQISIDKISIDKNSITQHREEESACCVDNSVDNCTFGKYKNVKLSLDEVRELRAELGEDMFNQVIRILDEYIQNTGKIYSKPHSYVIRNWVIDAAKEECKGTKSPPTKINRFNNFSQRTYSEEQMNELEKRLLSG